MNEKLWGMPIELAVGVIGLVGAIVGGLIAAGATVWVARWQAGAQLRMSRMDKLDTLVVAMYPRLEELAEAAARDDKIWALTEAAVRDGHLVVTRSRSVSPWFSQQIEEGVDRVLERAEAVRRFRAPGPDRDLERARVFKRQLEIEAFACAGLVVWWLKNPEEFERSKRTYMMAWAEVQEHEAEAGS